jgi:DNA repair exonuclease SbcCD nuclease subunit
MKFVHAADLHFGAGRQVLPNYLRRQVHALRAIYHTATAHNVDCVVLAGDIFDRSNVAPPERDAFLKELLRADKRGFTTLIVDGNHDEYFAGYCVDPRTRILGADLIWRPAEEVRVGDELVGFDEHGAGRERKFRRAVVQAKRMRKQLCYRVITDRGEMVASELHGWLVRPEATGGRNGCRQWIHTRDLKPGMVLAYFADPWPRDDSWDAGWLAGFYDGEGWINNRNVWFAQNPGSILRRARSLLKSRGFEFGERQQRADSHCRCLWLCGEKAGLRLLGMIRPQRLLLKASNLWEGRSTWGPRTISATVKSVEYVGKRDVCALQTSTRTLISEGFLTHNSNIHFLRLLYEHKRFKNTVIAEGAPEWATVAGQEFLLFPWHRDAAKNLVKESRRHRKPPVVVLHLALKGAKADNGYRLPSGEELDPRVHARYIALGDLHLCHRPIKAMPYMWYCGAPIQHDFGETLPKGCLVVDTDQPTTPQFVPFDLRPQLVTLTSLAEHRQADQRDLFRLVTSHVVERGSDFPANIVKLDYRFDPKSVKAIKRRARGKADEVRESPLFGLEQVLREVAGLQGRPLKLAMKRGYSYFTALVRAGV